MPLPRPIQLSQVELWLLAISKRHGVRGFVVVVVAWSVFLSVAMTATLMIVTGSSRENTIFAIVMSGVVPLSIAPLVAMMLARLLVSLDQATAEMEVLARTDSLTSLRNRRAFFEDAAALVEQLQIAASANDNSATDRPSPILLAVMVDVDNFKTVNDIHGHSVGDRALQVLADNLGRAVHDDTVIGRLGGDEFAVIGRVASPAAAMAVVERLRAACDLSEAVPGLRASLGYAVMGAPADVDALLAAADRNLYEAKRTNLDPRDSKG